MEWPESNEILIKTLATGNPNYTEKIKTLKMLGSSEEIKFKQTKAGLNIFLPSTKPCDFSYGIMIN